MATQKEIEKLLNLYHATKQKAAMLAERAKDHERVLIRFLGETNTKTYEGVDTPVRVTVTTRKVVPPLTGDQKAAADSFALEVKKIKKDWEVECMKAGTITQGDPYLRVTEIKEEEEEGTT